jgi:hypothetical protein
MGWLLRIRENPIRALDDLRAMSVGGRSIRKRLARTSSTAFPLITASRNGLKWIPGATTFSPFPCELPRTVKNTPAKARKIAARAGDFLLQQVFQVNLTKRSNSYNFALAADGTVRASSGANCSSID